MQRRAQSENCRLRLQLEMQKMQAPGAHHARTHQAGERANQFLEPVSHFPPRPFFAFLSYS